MSTLNKQRTKRVRRILVLEEKKLNASTTELQIIQYELRQQQNDLERLETIFQNTIEDLSKTQSSLSNLCQAGTWSERARKSIKQTQTKLAETIQQRDKLLNRVTEQRATVKGWTLLVEKLELEAAQKNKQESIINADDDFLRKRYRRDS